LELALVDRVGDHVANAAGTPDVLRVLAPDTSAVASVGGRNAKGVQLGSDPPAGPALQSDPLVDPVNQPGGRDVAPHEGFVGHEAGGRLVALDPIPGRPDPTRIAALSGCSIHPVGRTPGELAAVVVGYDGLDVVAEEIWLSFDDGHESDAQGVEAAAHDQEVHGVAAEAVDLVDP
jgi:hypothetical protein